MTESTCNPWAKTKRGWDAAREAASRGNHDLAEKLKAIPNPDAKKE